MDTKKREVFLRKTFFAALWSVVFFLLTSTCCLVYFSSTAYEFADLAMIDGTLDENDQPLANRADMRNTGAKVAYAFASMHESSLFIGLFAFSVVVSIFAGYTGILPGTDQDSIALLMEREEEDESVEDLLPYCPNCGTDTTMNFCPNCGQERFSAQKLTLGYFIKSAIPDILNIDIKFFRTLRFLLTKPGFLTLEYLEARRASYTLPTQLYFVIAALFFLVSINLDFSIDAIIKQIPQLSDTVIAKAQAANIPVELFKERFDNTLENYLPFYTFFMVIAFALCLKVLYPNWYYVEHLIFSLHFIAYFLILWMVLILVALRFPAMEQFGPVAPLPYLYFALKRVHFSSSTWKIVPAALFFLLLFGLYLATSIGLLIL